MAEAKNVMCVDAGDTTGVVILDVDDGKVRCLEVSCGAKWPQNEMKIVSLLYSCVVQHNVKYLVLEDFVLRVSVPSRSRSVLSSCRIAFALQCLVDVDEVVDRVIWQSPSDALGVFTDYRLHEMGLWIRGSDHARDAMRHLGLYLRKNPSAGRIKEVEKIEKVVAK